MDNTMLEREQEQRIPEERRSPQKKKITPLIWAAFVCSAAALTVSIAALSLSWPGSGAEPEPVSAQEPEAHPAAEQYITYKKHQLPLEEELAVSAWNPAGFSLEENGWLSYESGGVSALPGIDVSSHQGEIDWQKVAASGVEFAMIRTGYRGYGEEGRLMLDERFHENMAGALDAGLDVGVYFFSQATTVWEAEEEARLLLDILQGYTVSYPVVFDWENIHHSPARTDAVVGKSVTLMAEAFCGLVEQAGYTPGVYFNQNLAYLDLDLGRLADHVFWLAEYERKPSFYYHFDLWQYSSKGTVPGISTPVDLNLSFRDFGGTE